jgi:type VI protein secretion system component VasK
MNKRTAWNKIIGKSIWILILSAFIFIFWGIGKLFYDSRKVALEHPDETLANEWVAIGLFAYILLELLYLLFTGLAMSTHAMSNDSLLKLCLNIVLLGFLLSPLFWYLSTL